MAKKRAARRQWRTGGIALSLSLSLLLIAPLLLPGANFELPQKALANSSTFSNLQPATRNSSPLPGEVIVRFKAAYAGAIYQALQIENANQPDFRDNLIGARVDKLGLYTALPQLGELWQSFDIQAADAILPEQGAYLLKFNQTLEPQEAAQKLVTSGFFDYAEPDFRVYAFREPNVPLYRVQQTVLRQINAPDAWDITTGTDNIVIAVVDSGVLANHPDLTGKVLNGMNYVSEPANSNTNDDYGHGSYVAGIAAANTANGIGMAGIAWGARILPVKVLDSNGVGTNATIAKGIAFASQRRAQIINISLGGPDRSKVVEDAARLAFNRGAVLIGAVGNNGDGQPNYPAAIDTVIAVGALDARGGAAYFSNYGPEVSLLAPGVNIIGPWLGSPAYISDSGTSSAAPFVAGTAALMLSVNPGLSNNQIRNILEGTADNLSASPTANSGGNVRAAAQAGTFDARQGFGRLNIFKAVQAAQRNDIYPSRRAQLQGTISGVSPLEVVVTLQPGDARIPDANGSYSFSNLPPGDYTLKIEARKYGLAIGPNSIKISGYDGELYNRDFDLGQIVQNALNEGLPVGAFKSLKPTLPNKNNQFYFNETGHLLKDKFLKFWQDNGQLPVFGYPISEEFTENGLRVQYFERAVMEYHPEYAGTKSEIQLRRLGSELAKDRKDKAFAPVSPPVLSLVNGKLALPPYSYFYETSHTLRGEFLDYWKANGGLNIFGLPISEEVIENGRRVQYFERYRLEIFPEFEGTPWAVLGSLLARDVAVGHGLLPQPTQ